MFKIGDILVSLEHATQDAYMAGISSDYSGRTTWP